MQAGSWDIKDAPQDRPISVWLPDEDQWEAALYVGDDPNCAGGWSIGRDYYGTPPTRWAELPSNPSTPYDNRNVTPEQAESYVWWEHYLQARMDALQAMVLLGKDDAEIRRVIGTDGPHVDRLLCVARGRLEGGS